MNTPKKDDMIEELQRLEPAMIREIELWLTPIMNVMSLLSRRAYLKSEISKVTPKVEQKEMAPSDV